MGNNLSEICKLIRQYNPQMILRAEESSIINAVIPLEKKLKQFESDILYMGEASDLPPLSEIRDSVNFLIYLNKASIPEEYKNSKQINWLIINECQDPAGLLLGIRESIEKGNRIMQNSLTLYNALLSGKGLQNIVDKASELYGSPIFVADVSFKVLAFTKAIPVSVPFWKEDIEGGYISDNTVKNAKREGIISQVFKSENPTILDFYHYHTLSERLIIDGEIVGFVSILEGERSFRESDIELVRLLCEIISNELKKDKYFRNPSGVVYDTIILDLLSGKKIQKEILHSRLEYFNLKLGKYLYILIVKFFKNPPDNFQISYLRNALEASISRNMAVVYNDSIVLLISRDSKKPLSKSESEALLPLLRENKMVSGVSRAFQEISDLSTYYLQAYSAAELGSRLKSDYLIFPYDDYSFYHLLSKVEEKVDLNVFCLPSLMDLIEYDKQNKTRYTESLYAYICTGCNAAESARIFNIHRNSMDYRIKKIEELLNISIKDPEINFSLFLSFKILLFIKEKNLDWLHIW